MPQSENSKSWGTLGRKKNLSSMYKTSKNEQKDDKRLAMLNEQNNKISNDHRSGISLWGSLKRIKKSFKHAEKNGNFDSIVFRKEELIQATETKDPVISTNDLEKSIMTEAPLRLQYKDLTEVENPILSIINKHKALHDLIPSSCPILELVEMCLNDVDLIANIDQFIQIVVYFKTSDFFTVNSLIEKRLEEIIQLKVYLNKDQETSLKNLLLLVLKDIQEKLYLKSLVFQPKRFNNESLLQKEEPHYLPMGRFSASSVEQSRIANENLYLNINELLQINSDKKLETEYENPYSTIDELNFQTNSDKEAVNKIENLDTTDLNPALPTLPDKNFSPR